jgi:hypothetical protein
MNVGGKFVSKLLIGAAAAMLIGGCGREEPSAPNKREIPDNRTSPTVSAHAAPTGVEAKTADTGKARFWKPLDY